MTAKANAIANIQCEQTLRFITWKERYSGIVFRINYFSNYSVKFNLRLLRMRLHWTKANGKETAGWVLRNLNVVSIFSDFIDQKKFLLWCSFSMQSKCTPRCNEHERNTHRHIPSPCRRNNPANGHPLPWNSLPTGNQLELSASTHSACPVCNDKDTLKNVEHKVKSFVWLYWKCVCIWLNV